MVDLKWADEIIDPEKLDFWWMSDENSPTTWNRKVADIEWADQNFEENKQNTHSNLITKALWMLMLVDVCFLSLSGLRWKLYMFQDF